MTAAIAFRTRAFAKRLSVGEVEEGELLAPNFDHRGLIPVVTTDARTGDGADPSPWI